MRLSDRAGRWFSVTNLAARVYIGYKAITLGEKRLGFTTVDADLRRMRHHSWSAGRLYDLAVTHRGLLIKFGQIIGSRPDMVPDPYVDVLSRLQDQVPPRSFRTIKRAVERELQRPLADVFAEFSETPIASASLAQVHRAVLKDGRIVAVKVQYPGIQDIVENDLANIRFLLRVLSKFERNLDFTPLIEEISHNVPLELDFINEGHNAELIASNFAGRENIIVPKITWEYTTQRVLTMEYVDGIKITDVPAMQSAGIDPQEVSQLVSNTFCEMIYLHGMFHADPHPGNLFVQPPEQAGDSPKLVLLDFGLCRKIDDKFRIGYSRLVEAMLTWNLAEMVQAFQDLGVKVKRPNDPSTYLEIGRSFMETSRPGRAYVDPDLVAEANQRVARAVRANPIVDIPREMLLIMRVVGLLSGLGKHLDSRVDVANTILPFARAAQEGAR
ncbi:MAG TPA: ABC1 kinase family protein [Dehalococcoidia bacterium]|nr:ABC1 kinase family protein [Dehalococcoidia bacterium]